ncbi:MAG: hypothetical protein MUE63_03355 [Xanthomonadales bacterium]|nr:hypothetical protein [Xanthomonadales bacterium]
MLATLLGALGAVQAQDRVPVQDARSLLIAAIESPSGQAQGVLVGDIADRAALCAGRLQPPEGAFLAGRRPVAGRAGTAPPDHRIRHQLLPRRPAAQVAVVSVWR